MSVHHVDLCKYCLDFKPTLMFQHTLYKYHSLQSHVAKEHPRCFFCENQFFYDIDKLNLHYRKEHFFCDVCRRQGRRMRQVSRQSNNLPEFEVFADAQMLRQHYKQNHHVCDKAECYMLVFEDAYTLTAHYLKVHNERRYTKVEFGFIDDDEEVKRKKPT